MIKGLFLDLDDTILDFRRAEQEALRRALQEFRLPSGMPVMELYHEINRRQWERLETGELTRQQVMDGRFEILLSRLEMTADAAALCERYEGNLKDEAWLLSGARETLCRLGTEYRLFAASNGAMAVQHSRMEKAGLLTLFEQVFISEELGADKPSPLFFRRALARIGDLASHEILMVGDSLTSDIRGGLQAGMHTCWINPQGRAAGEWKAEYELRTLTELPALLEQMRYI